MKTNVNPHNVAAVVQRGNDVEVRYGDGKEPVLLTNTNTSKVLKDIQHLKMSWEPPDHPGSDPARRTGGPIA